MLRNPDGNNSLCRRIKDHYGRPTSEPSRRLAGTYIIPDQMEMVAEFKNIFREYMKQTPANDLEWLCIMQHYGIPTKLLDWTVDPMIAMFFATDIDQYKEIYDMSNDDSCAEMWILQPTTLNSWSIYHKLGKVILDTKSKELHHFAHNDTLSSHLAFNIPLIEERLALQKKGCFTIHGGDFRPLDLAWHNKQGIIDKIEIPKRYIRQIRNDLNSFGSTADYYYPNDHSIYKPLRDNQLKQFNQWYLNYWENRSENEDN